MFRALSLAALLVAAPYSAFADAAPPAGAADAAQIKPYSSAKWGVSALFPYGGGVEKPQGEGIMVSSGNADDSIAYMLSVTPIADEVFRRKTTELILSDAVKGAVDNVKGTITSQRDITLSGWKGKEVVIQAEGFIANCRIYLAGKRLVLPMVIYAPNTKLPVSTAAFQAGFQLHPLKR